jgi:hypothetical protein
MTRNDPPPEVRAALGPIVEWIVTLAIETALKHAKVDEGPRYYDATNAPMGKTAFLRLAAQRAFPSFKVGKRVRALASDVHAYIEAQQGAKPRAPRAPVVAPPVDVNDLSPAELHELTMKGALPYRRGK